MPDRWQFDFSIANFAVQFSTPCNCSNNSVLYRMGLGHIIHHTWGYVCKLAFSRYVEVLHICFEQQKVLGMQRGTDQSCT